MKREEKELLLRDLCARLPYEVKVNIEGRLDAVLCDVNIENGSACIWVDGVDYDIEYVRPYLRPMSSMTEGEKVEYCALQDKFLRSSEFPVTDAYEIFDWLNSHHFDFRNLIEKGLAIEAPDGMYNQK